MERVFLVILKVILKQTRKKVFYLFLGKSDHCVSRTGLVSRLTMPRFLAEAFKYLFPPMQVVRMAGWRVVVASSSLLPLPKKLLCCSTQPVVHRDFPVN